MAEGEEQADDERAEDDEARFARYSGELADGIEAALPAWVRRSVTSRLGRTPDAVADPGIARATDDAAGRCQADVAPRIRELLLTDLDEQRTTPLAILRSATSYATAVLRDAGVAEVPRDEFDQRAFPADVYALSPASFADIDESLREPGLIWGAAKAHIHLSRRRGRVE